MTTKNTEFVDLLLTQDSNGVWDISFTDDGDIAFTNGLDTALSITFFTDQRASPSEVSTPEYRRGWWGTTLATNELELGSKLWLLEQSINNQDTLIKAIDFTQKAYQWLIDFNYADNIQVTGLQTRDNITLTILIIKNSDVISQKSFDLWENTIESIT